MVVTAGVVSVVVVAGVVVVTVVSTGDGVAFAGLRGDLWTVGALLTVELVAGEVEPAGSGRRARGGSRAGLPFAAT